MAELKDSGNRTEYDSGAVRDCKEGKGRCDLMPLDVVSRIIPSDRFFDSINSFKYTGELDYIIGAINRFSQFERQYSTVFEMLLDVAIHYEDGARKYGPNNWQKGIPLHSYIDSAIRHYLKYKAGWTDEPHDRAVIWNLMCGVWTFIHHPELDDFTEKIDI